MLIGGKINMKNAKDIILNVMKRGKEYTTKELAKLSGFHEVWTRVILHRLEEEGKVKSRWFGQYLWRLK